MKTLFSNTDRLVNSKTLEPKTNFPKKPFDRWTNWIGVLEKDDWNFIFTESVYKYIYCSAHRKGLVMGFDALTCEEIALSVTGETVLAVKKICQKPSKEDRTVRVSIRAVVNTISNRWFQNFITRFYSDKNLEHDHDVENLISESSDVEKYTLRTEILSEIFDCLDHLSDKGKLIINGFFFEDKKLKDIATKMQIEHHKIVYIKEQAEKKIADCMKSKGFNEGANNEYS
jgi:RNA polymerase sigma factor (sigma-70 family)